MKYFLLSFFLFIGFTSFSQNPEITEKQFLSIEMSKIKKNLNTPALELSNDQNVKIQKLLKEKFSKVHASWNSDLTKEEVSKRRGEIDNEYAPLVEGILTNEQRMALMQGKQKKVKS
jgi:hypothetical protein